MGAFGGWFVTSQPLYGSSNASRRPAPYPPRPPSRPRTISPPSSYSNIERTATSSNGTSSYTWASSNAYWSGQGGSSPQASASPAPYRTPPHAYPAPVEYAGPPANTTAPTTAPTAIYPLQYDATTQHHSPYYQHAYAPYAHHAVEDISYWPNSLNSYGYQPTAEYVGTGDVAYADSMAFGSAAPLEPTPASEDRTTPSGSEHQAADREYKYNTEEERHSPCEDPSLPPRSPAQ